MHHHPLGWRQNISKGSNISMFAEKPYTFCMKKALAAYLRYTLRSKQVLVKRTKMGKVRKNKSVYWSGMPAISYVPYASYYRQSLYTASKYNNAAQWKYQLYTYRRKKNTRK